MTLHQTITVLIIDDDEDDRFFMEQAFKTDSIHTQLHLAADGQQALDLLSAVQPLPDVVLLDLNMPGLSGFEVLKHLKQSACYQSIPVIILTTSEAEADQEQTRQWGPLNSLPNPLRITGWVPLPNAFGLV